MNYSLLDQIEFDTYDRKIRKIKVDIIKCFIYIAKLKCYQCPDGYAKSSVDSIYCVKCNNLLDKGKLKLD